MGTTKWSQQSAINEALTFRTSPPFFPASEFRSSPGFFFFYTVPWRAKLSLDFVISLGPACILASFSLPWLHQIKWSQHKYSWESCDILIYFGFLFIAPFGVYMVIYVKQFRNTTALKIMLANQKMLPELSLLIQSKFILSSINLMHSPS